MDGNEIDIFRREIKCLRDTVNKLEARVGGLEKGLARSIKSTREYEELLERHLDRLQDGNTDAFSRIKNIELQFFPHLLSDLDQLHSIIKGEDNQRECPLEKRDPKKT